MTPLSNSILATLAYSDIFDYPLTQEEIGKWLIVEPSVKFKVQSQVPDGTWQSAKLLASLRPPRIDRIETGGRSGQFIIQNVLALLSSQHIIEKHSTYYCLKGRKEIISQRKERERCSKDKLLIAKITAKKLNRVPWINMIGITGSLAMNNSSADDDIDLMIVTQNNRLWLVRSLILVLSPILGIARRKHNDKNVKNKICFNMFVDESSLVVSARNLYTAHEIAQIRPLFNCDQTYEKLITANHWINNYLPIAIKENNEITIKRDNDKLITQLLNYPLSLVNYLAFIFQYLYMKSNITNETVALHKAYFHPRLLSDEIENHFLTRLKTINRIAIGRVE